VAKPDRDVRVLPERASADLDWLVPGASAELVPRRDGGPDACNGVADGLDGYCAGTMADCVLLSG
jgi:hypothetical protein